MVLEERRKALEEQFFHKQNAKQLEQLREQQRNKDAKQALEVASGISNDELLTALVETGIAVDTLAAVALVPLVEVAWADGIVQEEERVAIMKAATDAGIEENTGPHALLSDWLTQRPPPQLMTTWKAYVGELLRELSDEQRKTFGDKLVARATIIAKAAGGFLGIKSIDSNEKRVLEEISAALHK